MCAIEDGKISTDRLIKKIEEFEDYVQFVDIAAFNKNLHTSSKKTHTAHAAEANCRVYGNACVKATISAETNREKMK